MFIRRSELTALKAELAETKKQLREEKSKTRHSALIEKAGLPPCKSLACADCEHIVWHFTPRGNYYVVGCGKDNPCSDYKKSVFPTSPVTVKSAISEALQSQLES